jgi:alpha-N-arabinofuranosidase
VLDRLSQLPLDEIRFSGGLYAPTIRYSDGVFYVINTLVDGKSQSGNFIVTATNPAGPWSEPIWLENAPGFDPSLFFDDNGRVWCTGNRLAEDGYYPGHTEIWLQELDLESMRFIGDLHILWDGAVKGAVWSEAAHIYKVAGRYYLLTAEGGTAHHHAVSVARSEQITGPYEGCRANPILTHRHLGLDYPIVGTGHADLIDTPNGEWWMVLLGMRPYGGYFYNLGRETFLVPVIWEDGWPIASPGTGRVEFSYQAPDLPEQRWSLDPACDHFETQRLAPYWNFLRTPRDEFWSLKARPGYLRLKLRPQRLSEQTNPSFIGRRQQQIHFMVRTALEFIPQTEHESAGLVLRQNEAFHFRFVITRGDRNIVRLIQRCDGQDEIMAETTIAAERVYLKIVARAQSYNFYAASQPNDWQPVAEDVDGRILSTSVAGGFVGAYLGMYASSNGHVSENYADFDWFELIEIGTPA